MTRLRKSTATGQARRLHKRRWRGRNQLKPSREDLLQAASDEARLEGKSLTLIRRHVLDVLLKADRAMTAYEVLSELEGVGSISPPTAYRALEFLIELGYVKRVETLNAYLALTLGPSDLPVALFVCETCGDVCEIDAPEAVAALISASEAAGFGPRKAALEMRGDCHGRLACQKRDQAFHQTQDSPSVTAETTGVEPTV